MLLLWREEPGMFEHFVLFRVISCDITSCFWFRLDVFGPWCIQISVEPHQDSPFQFEKFGWYIKTALTIHFNQTWKVWTHPNLVTTHIHIYIAIHCVTERIGGKKRKKTPLRPKNSSLSLLVITSSNPVLNTHQSLPSTAGKYSLANYSVKYFINALL